MIPIIFKNICPNCHSDIESLRLDKGLTCKNCMEDDSVSNICKYLAEKNTLKALEDYCKLKNELKELENVAERCGFKLLSIQRMWAKRVLKNKSFSIVAPTGVGKSVFGMITAIYFATKNKKSYIILPTTLLVRQTYEKIINMANKAGIEVNVVAYHSELSSEEKRLAKEKIEKKDYNILITTSNYLSKNPIDDKFDFVFIDDVDAFLKASKNIDKSLKLLGFSDEIIKKAYNILYLIRKKKIEDALKEREKLKEMISKIDHGCMIVASATGKSYGDKVKLYRELLDFEIGYGMSKLRDVEDIYDENLSLEKILEYIKIFGDGGIVFVPIDYGLKKAEEIEEFLIKNGVKAKLIHSKDKKGFEEFKNGEIDVLIGVASYYGVLVRGLDIPERIRYCIFYGVPKFKTDLEETLKKEDENISIEGLNKEELMELVKNTLKIKNFSLRKEEDKYYLLIPDVKTYIQTSGRTSRMTENGLIKGASIVLVDDAEVFEGLKKYMLFMYESEFKRIDEIDVEKLIEKIDEDRRKLKETKEKNKVPDLLKSALMVVESPNKARTIANFFGKPSVRRINNKKVYEVCIGDWNLIITASGGHIFDLVTKEGYHGVLVGNNSYIPIYGTIKRINGEQFVDEKNIEELIKRIKERTNGDIVIHDAKENIEILRDLASEVDAVFIATDIDVEGEKIGYDIYLNLKPFNKNIFRIGFNEITKRAITNAIKMVKEGKSEELLLDENKVRAQVVRRIEDRWIGFELSKKLWDAFNNTYLSAGRVQTPVLGWIIDRYNEYQIKVPYLYLKLENDISFGTIVDEEIAKRFKDKDYVDVEVNVYEKGIYPNPPFTTDTLLEEATKRFGLSSDEVMKIAQELFELGLCLTPDTYVVLGDGRIETIEDIINAKEKDILSLNLDNLSIKRDTAIKFWKLKYIGNLRKITLSNNYELKATPDHCLLVLRDSQLRWIPAKDIKENDYIAMPFNYKVERKPISLLNLLKYLGITDVLIEFDENSTIFEKIAEFIRNDIKTSTKYKYLRNRRVPLKYLIEWDFDLDDVEKEAKYIYKSVAGTKKIPLFKLDEKFWYFAGLVLGDGSIQDSKIKIAQTPLKDVKRILDDTFPFLHNWISGSQVIISNPIIAEILKKLGMRNGKLNGIIFSLPESCINALIAGYFDTDGCFSLLYDKKAKKHNLRMILTSKRKDVLEKIGIYLNSIGILNTIHKNKEIYSLIISNKSLETFKEKIAGYLGIRKETFVNCYRIYRKEHGERFECDLLPVKEIFGKLTFEKGRKKILKDTKIHIENWYKEKTNNIPREKLKTVLRYANNSEYKKFLEKIVYGDISFVRVKKVEDIPYNGYVYDLSIKNNQNFISNGVISHNCTYHRTSSTRVSLDGMRIAREYLELNNMKDYLKNREYYMEGAHECIRPTKPMDTSELIEFIKNNSIYLTKNHIKIYDLIFRRFIASQMKECKVEYEEINIKDLDAKVEGYISIIYDGWTKIYNLKLRKLPKIEKNTLKIIEKSIRKVPKVSLYDEGEVIKLMKERSIGRPSTYAQIVKKLFDRKYVLKSKDKGKIIPTKLGIEVYNYLKNNYYNLICEERTKELEEIMDKIEKGGIEYIKVLDELLNEIKLIA
ncbi:reverse gyrase [Methanotorris formicicus]|uniref:Reverse gyrase n=1 Tax=Methanotorris formicicus Mc-S-70 TaxID=647171 RepID=H1KWZ3_9EURY|nr:reverse gyrase [Methanotorris formicicus]EHP88819.1 reverse gyrase [Methanotorris formicicus Mc-S-70]